MRILVKYRKGLPIYLTHGTGKEVCFTYADKSGIYWTRIFSIQYQTLLEALASYEAEIKAIERQTKKADARAKKEFEAECDICGASCIDDTGSCTSYSGDADGYCRNWKAKGAV